ncbi:MAG: GIY-YIG nuclease family protein, partial [Ignavibacteria bacterium]
YFVYILRSLKNGKYYIGQTQDLESRIKVHNSAKARWTKRYQPWELIHSEIYTRRCDAMKREKFLKNIGGIRERLNEIVSGKL